MLRQASGLEPSSAESVSLPELNHRVSASIEQRLPALFLILGLVLGPLYSLILPPLQAPDEIAHFLRAYLLSEGHCVAQAGQLIPQQIRELQSLYPVRVEDSRHITPAEILALARIPLAERPQTVAGYVNSNLYSCIPYIAPSAAIAVARMVHTPVIDLIYLGRLANVLMYLALVYLAVRVAPGHRLLLLALALMPMTLHQAASLSADSLSFGASFLLCAYILKLAFGPQKHLTLGTQAMLAAVVLVTSLSKFNVWLALLILLIPSSRFRSARERFTIVAIPVVVAFLSSAAWQYLNRENVAAFESLNAAQGINGGVNLRYIYQEPVLFTAALVRTVSASGYTLLSQFVGTLGWLSVQMPAWLIVAYTALLATLALTGSLYLTWPARIVVGVAVVGSFVTTFVLLWSFLGTQSLIDEISSGKGLLPGVQGRYFIPIALPGFLLLSNRRLRLSGGISLALSLTVIIVSNFIGFDRICRLYYVSPSSQPGNAAYAATILRHHPDVHPHYEGNLVQRPGSSSEDGKVYVVLNGQKHWVQDSKWIVNHGYQWPGDIVIISGPELAAIPTAGPLNSTTDTEQSNPSFDSRVSPYEGELVRRPGSTPEDGKIYIVRKGVKHWVTDHRWIIQNGFRWPNDVKVISGADLDAIPLGEPYDYKP